MQLSYQGTKKGFLQRLIAYLAEQPAQTAESTPAVAEVNAVTEQPAPLALAIASPEIESDLVELTPGNDTDDGEESGDGDEIIEVNANKKRARRTVQ